MRVLVAGVVLLLAASPGSGLEGVAVQGTDPQDFREEPNVRSAGYHWDPDGGPFGYPADDNGIREARDGPSRILNVKWMHGRSGDGVDSAAFFGGFLGKDWIVPAVPGEFLAWHGVWNDVDADGWLVSDRMPEIDLTSRCAPTASVGSKPGWTPAGVATTVAYDCGSPVEWEPEFTWVVSYVTPGRPVDVLLTPTLFADDRRQPDIGGYYYDEDSGVMRAPSSLAWFAFADNSVVQTLVVESFSRPKNDDGSRAFVPSQESRVDVDVHPSFDTSAENIYRVSHGEATPPGCDLRRPERSLPFVAEAWDHPRDPCGGEALDAPAAAHEVIGPAVAAILPRHEHEDFQPPVYFDAYVAWAAYRPLVVAAGDEPLAELSPSRTGVSEAPLLAGVYGHLGVWRDHDGDGYVGSPRHDPPCPDAHRCGLEPDPDVWGGTSEWTPLCARPPPGGNAKVGEIQAWLEPSQGSWPLPGAYVLSDRAGIGWSGDPYRQDGRQAFNPWDDAAMDVFDGRVDRLVLRDAIPLHLVCGRDGYRSYEHVLLPAPDATLEIHLLVPSFEVEATWDGITGIFDESDADVIRGWQL